MDSSESFLKTVIERLRGYIDDTDFDAKYSDQYLMQHVVMPSLVDVQARLNINADNPVYLEYNVTTVPGQEYYVLPPCVGEIMRVVQYDYTGTADGMPLREWIPKSTFSLAGPVWTLQGNMISFRPYPTTADPITIIYITNGDMRPHYGDSTATGTLNAGLTTFTMNATPTIGLRDKRDQAYAGQILRLFGTNKHEERIITAFDPETRIATVARPFTLTNAAYSYEVAPPNFQSMTEAVTLAATIKLGTWRKISQAQHSLLVEQYRMAIKTITDQLANKQARTGKSWQKDTRDNPDWRP